MSKIGFFLIRAVWLASFLLSVSLYSPAQTTIFNIPTADTQSRGSVSVEVDFIAKPVAYRNGGYQTYGYRVAYGLNNKTELGSNFYYTWDGTNSTGQAEFSLKRNIYSNERRGVKVSVGTVVFVPLRNTTGDRVSFLTYTNASKTIEPLNGMTVTGGLYHVSRGSKTFGTRTGALIGVVQPVKNRFSFVADWFSGNNRFGYASAGVNYAITKRQFLLAGYSFGNSGRGNNAFAAYYGYTF